MPPGVCRPGAGAGAYRAVVLRFVPYAEAAREPNVVVDGSPNDATVLTLSHWPGVPAPEGLADDLSAQMAFRYVDAGAALHGPARVVSNNHFDQDGLVGIVALVAPDWALRHRELLVEVARAGDFATTRSRTAARLAAAVVSSPDAGGRIDLAGATGGDACGLQYQGWLELLPRAIADPSSVRDLWAEDDEQLARSESALADGSIVVTEEPELDLAVVTVPAGAPRPHPVAVHNATDRFRLVYVHGRRYEVVFRYESWVQYRSRRPLPRVDLEPLAAELAALEREGTSWSFTGVGALQPRLAADGDSAVEPAEFLAALRRQLAGAPPAWDPYRPGA